MDLPDEQVNAPDEDQSSSDAPSHEPEYPLPYFEQLIEDNFVSLLVTRRIQDEVHPSLLAKFGHAIPKHNSGSASNANNESLFGRLRIALFGKPARGADRLAEFPTTRERLERLTFAIERDSAAPVNYLMRGELLLEVGDYGLAAQDFEKTVELAAPDAESANWGYINRALADRAREGLRACHATINT